MMQKILVATSSCLLGNNVRFNGANSHKKLITETLGSVFNLLPICPELAAGFGVPRPPIRLQQLLDNKNHQVISHDHQKNVTTALEKASLSIIDKLPVINGFILKKGSPSCGAGSVKLYNERQGIISYKEDGVFVAQVKKKLPLLPIEDEGRLNDAYLKEHFIKRVFLTYEANRNIFQANNISDLMAFHARHKILLRLHHPDNQKILGRMLSEVTEATFKQIKQEYYSLFLASFLKVAKRGNHFTILQRVLREINKLISKVERADLQKKIELFRAEKLPLAVPVEIIKHYLIRYNIEYLKQQSYLNLYPENLGLMSDM